LSLIIQCWGQLLNISVQIG